MLNNNRRYTPSGGTLIRNDRRYTPTVGDEVVGLVMMTLVFVVYGAGVVVVSALEVLPTGIAVGADLVAAASGLGLVATWVSFLRTIRKPRVPPAQTRS